MKKVSGKEQSRIFAQQLIYLAFLNEIILAGLNDIDFSLQNNIKFIFYTL
jgi:hypothetical protein